MFSKRTILLSQKGPFNEKLFDHESIIITVESLCYSFTFKILLGSTDEMFFDEKMKTGK